MHRAALDDAVDSRFNAGAAETASRGVSGVYRNRKGFIRPIGQHNMLWLSFCRGWKGRGLLI